MSAVPRPSWAVRRRTRCLLVCAVVLLAACGKKGPPLPPLRLVPNGVTEVSGRRSGSDVELRFKLPTTNANGTGRIDLDRIEVFAVTVGLGAATPANRDLLTKTYAVGTILVKPPPVEGAGEPPPGTPPDTRPSPGDLITFVETLTDAKLTPAPLPKIATPPAAAAAAGTHPAAAAPGAEAPAAPAPAAAAPAAPVAGEPAPAAAGAIPPVPPLPAPTAAAPTEAAAAPAAPTAAGAGAAAQGAAPPAAAATPATPPGPSFTTRVYVVRGVSKAGRPGQPSTRVVVPLLPLAPAPDTPKASFTEKAIVLEWTPPTAPAEGGAVLFNVYRSPEAPATPPPAAPNAPNVPAAPQAPASRPPINTSPLAAARLELPAAEFGKRQCFTVRSVQVVANIPLEGEPTAETCVTPRDIFPPATPQRVSMLLLDGAIELVWDAGSEPDLAGYTILRAESPDDTLRPLTPTPVLETTYRDATVKSGVHYVYAVVAVDKAGNASPPSARVEGTAK